MTGRAVTTGTRRGQGSGPGVRGMGQFPCAKMRRLALMGIGLAALAFGGLGVGGCNVGEGKGTADGNLFVVGCKENDDGQVINFGQRGSPAEFHLNPTFFAGDPIEDIGIGDHKNRLRMSRPSV